MRFRHFLLFLLFAVSCAPVYHKHSIGPSYKSGLSIVCLNVGQGDATIIFTENRKAVLIDAGANFVIGTKIWTFIRDTLNIKHLDYIFASHYHGDHIGGMPLVLDSVLSYGQDSLVYGIFDRGYSYKGVYAGYVEKAGQKRTTVEIGSVYNVDDGVSLQVVCANGKTISGDSVVPEPNDENSKSIGLLLKYYDFKMIIASDIAGDNYAYRDVESILAPSVGKLSVLYVNHHSSATSSNGKWLSILQPKVSVISAGDGNQYNLPSPKTIDRLLKVKGNHIYQTEKGYGNNPNRKIVNGNIWIQVESKGFRVNKDKYTFNK